MKTKKILQKLCTDCGVSGREGEMLDIIRELSEKYAYDVRQLPTGTIVASVGDKNAKHHVMLDAHIDRIGLVVTYINEDGFLKAEPVGGMDLRALAGTAVTVQGREEVTGIICTLPPHLIKKEEGMTRDKIWIDTGLAPEKVSELIGIGDTAIVKSSFRELLGDKVAVSGLDNRAGCAVILKCTQIVSSKLKNTRLSLVFSSQEETNESGASTAAFLLEPDESIIVDVGFAKQEGVPASLSGAIGKGPIISIAPVLSRTVTNGLIESAKKLGSDFDYEVDGSTTGTNADGVAITKGGIPCAVISVPEKNMHTQTEIVSLEDIENTAKIIAGYLLGGASK